MLIHKTVTSILNKTKRRDPWFLDDYTVNPYSGCAFNCLYCYIRGSKYGVHMDQKMAVKTNAVEVLERQLANRAKKNQQGIVVVSSTTEPYLQLESELKLTRQFLELLAYYRFPVHIITKSDGVFRDLDLVKKINETAVLPADLEPKLQHRAFITFSFSTLDDQVSHCFEPGATPPSRRMEIMQGVLDQGIHSGVSLMPLLPFISDSQEQLDHFMKTFMKIGARYVFPASLTLFGSGPADSKTLMFRAIQKSFPQLLPEYEKLFSGYQIGTTYQRAFSGRVKLAQSRYPIPSAILQP